MLMIPRHKGVEFSWERKMKKIRGSPKTDEVLNNKGRRGCAWPGWVEILKGSGVSALSRAPEALCPVLKHQLVLCGEEEKHCGIIQRYLQTSLWGDCSKFL